MESSNARRNGRPNETIHLRELVHFTRRNLPLTIGIPVLVLLATAAFLTMATPVYEAEATLRIDEDRSNLALLDALRTLSSGSEIETEMEVLGSRSLAEHVVDSLDLNVEVRSPRGEPRAGILAGLSAGRDHVGAELRLERDGNGFRLTGTGGIGPLRVAPGETVTAGAVAFVLAPAALEHEEIRLSVLPFQEAVKRFRRTLDIRRPNREADLVAIRYEGTDSILVPQVTNAITELFITSRDVVRRTQARSTVRFLERQLDTLSTQLLTAEEDLRRYQEGALVINPEAEAKAQVARLADLQAQRDMVNAEREALARLLDDLQDSGAARAESPHRSLIAFPTLLRNMAAAELLGSLTEMENRRSELLSRRRAEDPDVAVLTARIEDMQQQLHGIGLTYLQGLSSHVASFDAGLEKFADQLERIPAREIRFARLRREAGVLEEIYSLLQTRLKEAQISAAVEDPSVRVVDPAIPPLEPVRPRPAFSLTLALFVGLAMGLGGAFVREHMDTTVRTREDLHRTTGGVPVLGLIPRIAAPNGGRLVTARDPSSPVSEAYRALRTNIAFSRMEGMPRLLVLTSATPGDGKSTTAANLAATLAQQEGSCVLVDADMRRGALNELFGFEREPGLSDVLVGHSPIDRALRSVVLDSGAKLDFLPTGVLPPNPAELLGSERMKELLGALRQRYSAVILDAPPLNVVTDAAVLGTRADGVILVARAGRSERAAVGYALEQLESVRAPVLGTLLNDIDVKRDRYYGSYAPATSYYSARD